MQKSFVERFFPHSGPTLPQVDGPRTQKHRPRGVSPIASAASSVQGSGQHPPSPLARSSLQGPPLAASVIHHADPLLPIDRVAKSLERHIQRLLDAQSEGLSSGLEGETTDDLSSTGSMTPTQSRSTLTRTSTAAIVMPVRQPTEKHISLRGARKGLHKYMSEFARLKFEELQILDGLDHDREDALGAAQMFQDKRSVLEQQTKSIAHDSGSDRAKNVRKQASKLDRDIRALEDKLFEMKAQHRQLLEEAKQIESSVGSELSSYRSSIAMIDLEIQGFLRSPPVTQALPEYLTGSAQTGLYTLKPERRSISMAREQWTLERNVLDQRRASVESERNALEDGSHLWKGALERIVTFERRLRLDIKSLKPLQVTRNGTSQTPLLKEFDAVIQSLENDLSTAETNHWNLLICALGAETEALRQGRWILMQTLGLRDPVDDLHPSGSDNSRANATNADNNDDNAPLESLIQYDHTTATDPPISPSTNSNKSLEATLDEFAHNSELNTCGTKETGGLQHNLGSSEPIYDNTGRAERLKRPPGSKVMVKSISHNGNGGKDRGTGPGFDLALTSRPRDPKSESEEDDDPGPAFLLSR